MKPDRTGELEKLPDGRLKFVSTDDFGWQTSYVLSRCDDGKYRGPGTLGPVPLGLRIEGVDAEVET